MTKQAKKKKRAKYMPFRTGHCQNGWCEGMSPKDYKGNPVPTCTEFVRCPCDCHRLLDEVFRAAGLDRILVNNSKYKPPKREYWMPGDPISARDAHSIGDGTSGPNTATGPKETPLRHDTGASSDRTPTGRRHKGDLELAVLLVCVEWAGDKYDWPRCTPKLVAEEIGRLHEVEPPSTGAVQAVWDRWMKLGFATYVKGPVRFGQFQVEDVSIQNLNRMKATRKRIQSRIDRGIR